MASIGVWDRSKMPKPLSEYTFRQHLRLQPLTHAVKTARYRRIDQKFLSTPLEYGDVEEIRRRIGNQNILATVAFDDPACLDMHLRLVKNFVTHDHHLIADNSRDAGLAKENQAIAHALGASYLKMSLNPWTRRNPSRSHGAVLNWLWHNLILPAKPTAFGFLDQDLFPTEATDPFQPLIDHDFYGDLRTANHRWFLWAGFCFYKYSAIRDKNLDFGLDWFAGLDTGGGNWDILYRSADRSALPSRPVKAFPAIAGVALDRACFERRGVWIHEVGFGNDPSLKSHKRAALIELLAGPLAQAAKATR